MKPWVFPLLGLIPIACCDRIPGISVDTGNGPNLGVSAPEEQSDTEVFAGDKKNYQGEWLTPGRLLKISPNRDVLYMQQGGPSRKRSGAMSPLPGRLLAITGDTILLRIQAGPVPVNTTLSVTKPPWNDGGTWKMIVDGKEMTRSAP